MKLFLIFIITSFSYISAAVIGQIEEKKGNIKVKTLNSIVKKKVAKGYKLQEGDIVTSYNDSYAKIVLIDHSTIILDKESILQFASATNLKQKSGRVFYKITSKKVKNSFQVKTDFAIIGIKGTTFIIKVTNDKEVLLKEGVVEIDSIKKEFELYRKKIKSQFEDFKSKQKEEFKTYKDEYSQYQKSMTKTFDLQKQHKISFDKNRVKEDDFNKKDKQEFKYFEKLIDEI
jgi:uncharacterized membrane-anchored protein YhcB (DUF1043 family)